MVIISRQALSLFISLLNFFEDDEKREVDVCKSDDEQQRKNNDDLREAEEISSELPPVPDISDRVAYKGNLF